MKRLPEPQAPTTRGGGQMGTYESHPAYATISICRSQGGARTLFASDFKHHHTISITIETAELNRNHGADRVSPSSRRMIDFEMSESQWAAFVCAFSVGEGTPITLRSFNGEVIPAILPPERTREDQANDEAKAAMAEAAQGIANLVEKINGMKISQKAKDELLDEIREARRVFDNTLPFYAEQFAKQSERTVVKAKHEIEAYFDARIKSAGLAALRDRSAEAPILIEGPKS